MKRALHFANKINFRGIQNVIVLGVSSYDLFASARKAVFPKLSVTGVLRLRLEICTIFVTKHKRMFQGAFLRVQFK